MEDVIFKNYFSRHFLKLLISKVPITNMQQIAFLRRTTAAVPAAGIQRIGDSKLCDLNFADDIALLTDSKENTRKVTSELSNQAAALGLQFNVKKTKIMEAGKEISGECISINGEESKT